MSKVIVFVLGFVITFSLLQGCKKGVAEAEAKSCKGAQKRVDDTFKVMDVCQQMIGCTVTIEDLRKAQEQLNQAEACK